MFNLEAHIQPGNKDEAEVALMNALEKAEDMGLDFGGDILVGTEFARAMGVGEGKHANAFTIIISDKVVGVIPLPEGYDLGRDPKPQPEAA